MRGMYQGWDTWQGRHSILFPGACLSEAQKGLSFPGVRAWGATGKCGQRSALRTCLTYMLFLSPGVSCSCKACASQLPLADLGDPGKVSACLHASVRHPAFARGAQALQMGLC